MQVQCPNCQMLLSLAGVHAAQVQCPGCGTVLDLSHLSQPAAPGYAGHVAQQPGYSPAAAPGGVPGVRGPAAGRTARVRRKKNNLGLWIGTGAVVVVAIALSVYAVKSVTTQPPVAKQPNVDPVVLQARSLVAKQLSLPSNAQFLPEYDLRQGPSGAWTVQSQVVIPGRSKTLRHKWRADIAQRDGKWQLRSLVLDGRNMYSAEEEEVRLASSTPGGAVPAGTPGAEPADIEPVNDGPIEDRTIGGAVRKVTAVAADAAKRRKTLVVWLIDHSASAENWRDGFTQHAQTVLDLLRNQNMWMSVIAYGDQVQFLVKDPSQDANVIREALQKAPEKDNRREVTFQAIKTAAETYRNFQAEGGYVYLVVVSDEAGDDPQLADEVTAALRRDSIAVYAIGREAPFGRKSWEGEDVSGPQAIDPVTEGPESHSIERIALSFWSGGLGDSGMLGSGFGPYALNRLCLQTGGEFMACSGVGSVFRASPSAGVITFRSGSSGGGGMSMASMGYEFPAALRRRYAPDYVTDAQYKALLEGNAAYRALVEAGKQPPIDAAAQLRTNFPVMNEAALKRLLDEAQREAARLEPRLSALYEVLSRGERDRAKVQSPRWQAAYDLAMGRVLAARARIEGYNAMLAQLKLGRNFENESSTRWELTPADSISAGSNYAKLIDQAKMYLERVIKDHPNTPWAHLASRELQEKMGWEWQER